MTRKEPDYIFQNCFLVRVYDVYWKLVFITTEEIKQLFVLSLIYQRCLKLVLEKSVGDDSSRVENKETNSLVWLAPGPSAPRVLLINYCLGDKVVPSPPPPTPRGRTLEIALSVRHGRRLPRWHRVCRALSQIQCQDVVWQSVSLCHGRDTSTNWDFNPTTTPFTCYEPMNTRGTDDVLIFHTVSTGYS